MDDRLLAEKILNGDKAALESLFNDHRHKVYRICLGYVQDRDNAEDLTQEVFIKVMLNIGQFKGQSKLSSWICRIAINLSLNFLRQHKKRLFQTDLSEADSLISEEQEISRLQINKSLRKAIQKLPERQKMVFILSQSLDMSYAEIAETAGISLSSVESLLFRARKNLRQILIQQTDEYLS